MDVEVSMEMVAGSSVSSAAVTRPWQQRPSPSRRCIMLAAVRLEEQAVSRLMAGPWDARASEAEESAEVTMRAARGGAVKCRQPLPVICSPSTRSRRRCGRPPR